MILLKTNTRNLNVISYEIQEGSAVLQTVEAGAVLVSELDMPEIWQAMIDAGIDMTVSQSYLDRKATEQKLAEIVALENQITQRMMREALLGNLESKQKIEEIENRIATKRR